MSASIFLRENENITNNTRAVRDHEPLPVLNRARWTVLLTFQGLGTTASGQRRADR